MVASSTGAFLTEPVSAAPTEVRTTPSASIVAIEELPSMMGGSRTVATPSVREVPVTPGGSATEGGVAAPNEQFSVDTPARCFVAHPFAPAAARVSDDAHTDIRRPLGGLSGSGPLAGADPLLPDAQGRRWQPPAPAAPSLGEGFEVARPVGVPGSGAIYVAGHGGDMVSRLAPGSGSP